MENIFDSTPRDNGPRPDAQQEVAPHMTDYTPEGILARIDDIRADRRHFTDALNALINLPPGKSEDGSDGRRAEAIAEIAKCREETNREMLRFLQKMYNDVTKPCASVKSGGFWGNVDLLRCIEHMDSDHISEFLLEIAEDEGKRHLLSQIDINLVVEMMPSDHVSEFLSDIAEHIG